MTYREEFPDFDPATLPAIPAAWVDVSWHNDACPSFDTGTGLQVYVDFAAVERRENGAALKRFTILSTRDATLDHVVHESDDWESVIAYVANEVQS